MLPTNRCVLHAQFIPYLIHTGTKGMVGSPFEGVLLSDRFGPVMTRCVAVPESTGRVPDQALVSDDSILDHCSIQEQPLLRVAPVVEIC